jgi:hypothetical protein
MTAILPTQVTRGDDSLSLPARGLTPAPQGSCYECYEPMRANLACDIVTV